MDPMSITLSITALLTLTKDVVLYIKNAKDAPEERKKFVREVSNLSGMLSTLVEFVNDCDPSDAWLQAIVELAVQDGPLDQFSKALQLLKSKLVPATGIRKLGQIFLWKLVKGDVDNLLLQIERLKSLVDIALDLDHISLSREIKVSLDNLTGDVADLQTATATIQDNTTVLLDDDYARRKAELLHRICSTDYLQQHRDVVTRHHVGTGTWFLEDCKYKHWLATPDATLFCPGVPGAGKTIIASLVIEQLLRTVRSTRCPVVLLYFNYKRQTQQTLIHTLGAILRQIVDTLPSIPEAVKDHYKHTPTLSDIESMLYSLTESIQGLVVVTDALDECHEPTRIDVLSRLTELQARTKVRYLATSRDFHAGVSNKIFCDHPLLEVRASYDDLEAYSRSRAQHLRAKVNPELLEDLVCGVVTAANGMFLLAKLLMDSFQDRLRVKKIKADLQRLPSGVDAYDVAYNDAMERIFGQPKEVRESAKRVLSWVLCAERPLSTSEIQQALMVEPEDDELDWDNALGIEEISAVCAGLVSIDEKSDTVGFVHYTTQEYLQRNRGKWLPGAEIDVARTCMTYLALQELAEPEQDWYGNLDLNRHSLLEYAAVFAGKHLNTLFDDKNRSDSACIITETLDFIRRSDIIQLVMEVGMRFEGPWSLFDSRTNPMDPPQLLFHSTRRGITGVHWISHYGLTNLCQLAITHGLSFGAKDSADLTPLCYAARRGHTDVIDLLLPLQESKAHDESEDVKLLCSSPADPSIVGHKAGGLSPLLCAAREGQFASLKILLLSRQFDIDARDNESRTTLSWAASNGDEQSVRLLLSEAPHISLDLADVDGFTPLMHAMFSDKRKQDWSRSEIAHDINIMALLLEHGRRSSESDPRNLESAVNQLNCRDAKGATPLLYANMWAKTQQVQILLEQKDTDPDQRHQHSGRTPLSYAAGNGSREGLEMLLGHSMVDANSKDHEGRTPLSFAAARRDESILKLLLQNDTVNADARDSKGRTPLSYAAECGNEANLTTLLREKEVEADSPDHDGRTPLSYAVMRGRNLKFQYNVKEGYNAIAEILLQRDDVDVNKNDIQGRPPLWYAIDGDDEAIVAQLLGSGSIDLTTTVALRRTLLSRAAYCGWNTVMALLLDMDDSDIDTPDELGRTPLSYAAQESREVAMEILITSGNVNVNAKDIRGRTPLSHAAENGWTIDAVELLCNTPGIDMNAADCDGRTPMWYAVKAHNGPVRTFLLAHAIQARHAACREQ